MSSNQQKPLSELFLQEYGSKHFVSMSYWCVKPDGNQIQDNVSCFVVEMCSKWFLVTAGHILDKMQEFSSSGYRYEKFFLADANGGANLPFNSFPISPELDRWFVLFEDDNGMDFAIRQLDAFDVRNLRVGGIRPISSNTWGRAPLNEYKFLVVVGSPEETVVRSIESIILKIKMIPIAVCNPPATTTPQHPDKVFAQFTEADNPITPSDLKGMSGSPVFGIQRVDGELKYWLVGIQSGWFPQSKKLTIYPVAGFLRTLEDFLANNAEQQQGQI